MTDSEIAYIKSLLHECVNAHQLEGDRSGSSFHFRCNKLHDFILEAFGGGVDVAIFPEEKMVMINRTVMVTL